MNLMMYTLHDTVAKTYSGISLEVSEATALRNFKAMINGKDGVMQFSASDYDLVFLGTYNSETGNVCPEPQVKVANGADVLINADNVRSEIDG